MKTPAKLGLYALGLTVLFAASFFGARAIIPASAAADWAEQSTAGSGEHGTEHGAAAATPTVPGLSVEQDGYRLTAVTAPTEVDVDGTLSFTLVGPDGAALTDYTTSHEKDLHLIVVGSDGSGFRHVHPTRDGAGVWSVPWRWEAAGSYRIFADFVPTALGRQVTLTSTITVAGEVKVQQRTPISTATVDGYTVELDGSMVAAAESGLTFTVTRDGQPVTDLQPYLGAFGHLVALRAGDLGYLHVHPIGEPGDGVTPSGPRIDFMATAPTAGEYWLYLDFQIDGQVRTAEFVVEALPSGTTTPTSDSSTPAPDSTTSAGHSGH